MKKSSPRRRKTKSTRASAASPVAGGVSENPSPDRKKRYNFASRKAKFARERDRSTSPSEERVPSNAGRAPYIPPSPDAAFVRSLRRTKERPSCIMFGPLREVLYPDYFFCGNCRKYEDCLKSGSLHGLASRESFRFRCTANHTDYFLPTQRRKQPKGLEDIRYITEASSLREEQHINCSVDISDDLDRVDYGSDEELLEDFRTLQAAFVGVQQLLEQHDARAAEEKEAFMSGVKNALQERMEAELISVVSYVNELKGTIDSLRGKVNVLQTSLNKYKKRVAMLESKESLPLHLEIVKTINSLVSSKQRYKLLSKQNLAANIAKAVFDPALCDGVALEEVIAESKKWLRNNVFKPSEILKQMDLRGGTLNYEGIKVLNDVEASASDGNKRRMRNRLICTPACLKRVAKELEKQGDILCPYSHIHTEFGEGIEFDYAKVTRLVINTFGLEDAAKQRQVNISASIDAARITKNLCHTSAGLKMSDIGGRDPLRNMRSFLTDEDSLRDLQSHHNVFLMKIILTKETKESFKQFDDIFQFFKLAELSKEQKQSHDKNNNKYKWEHLNDLQPLSVTFTTDMAADWKLVGAGGGVKNTEMFCTLCACTSSDVHQPNQTKCSRFCSGHHDPHWKCYHHPIVCNEVTDDLKREVEELKNLIRGDLEVIEHRSIIRYYVNTPKVACARLSRSIHFQPSNQDEKDDFLDLLMDELILRGRSPVGEVEDLRERLLVELQLEWKLRQHLKKLEHCTRLEQALIVLLHKIPCILHCENRVGLKLLSMLLREGFSNVQKGFLFGHLRSEKDRIMAYAESIERILNTVILGDEDGPAQWVLPYDAENKTVGVICLDNNRIRKILEHYELLINASVFDRDRAVKYQSSIQDYRTAMVILREKKEFTDEKIKEFQRLINCWFQLWNELWSVEGCTNYTHMLSSGHMAEFMFKWRNLYRFSQQGWEKFNHVFSTFYFRRTNHGGKRYVSAVKSKLIPIGRWLQRRLLWMIGYGDQIASGEFINEMSDQIIEQDGSDDESS